jgi:hypothetical protein
MTSEPQGVTLPNWVIWLGSAAVLFHLAAVATTALDAPSGPWVSPMGPTNSPAPAFAAHLSREATGPYCRLIKMSNSFHFASNRLETQEIAFRAVLKDAGGKVVEERRFPNPQANSAIQYRQKLLASQLGNDEPLPPQLGIIIPPPGQELPKLRWWQIEGEKRLKLVQDSPNAAPRNQQLMQPSAWSFLAVRSYVRHLTSAHDAASVEIVRTWHDPVLPMLLYNRQMPDRETLRNFQSSYGDLR